MSDLFQIPESKSPRLLWLEANDIHTARNQGVEAGDETEWGETIYPWCAFVGKWREVGGYVWHGRMTNHRKPLAS